MRQSKNYAAAVVRGTAFQQASWVGAPYNLMRPDRERIEPAKRWEKKHKWRPSAMYKAPDYCAVPPPQQSSRLAGQANDNNYLKAISQNGFNQ